MSMHHVERAAVLPMLAARKLVFMAICDAADKDTGLGFPGFDSMQEWSGVGKSQVHEHIAALIEDGYIERVQAGRRGRRAVFRVFAQVACCEFHDPAYGGSGTPDPSRRRSESGQPDPNADLGSGIGSGLGPVKGPAQTGPLPSTQASKQEHSVITDGDDHEHGATPTSPRTAKPTNAALDARFDEFWDAYDRKVAKGAAVKAWRAALRRGVTPDHLITAAAAFHAKQVRDDTPSEFVPHPASWLNAERYDDEEPTTTSSDRPGPTLVHQAPDGLTDAEYLAWQRDQLLTRRHA